MEIYTPGVYAVFEPPSTRTISGAGTSITAMVGIAEKGVTDEVTKVHNFTEFSSEYGDFMDNLATSKGYLAYAAYLFFQNGGKTLYVQRLADNTSKGAMSIKSDSDSVLDFTATSEGEWIEKYMVLIKKVVTRKGDLDEITFLLSFLKRDSTNPDHPKKSSVVESYSGLTMDNVVETLSKSGIATVTVGSTVGDSLSEEDAIDALDGSGGVGGTYYAWDSEMTSADSSVTLGAATVEDISSRLVSTAEGNLDAALNRLKVLDDIAIVAFPGLDSKAANGQTFAKTTHGDCFFIADSPLGKTETEIVEWRNDAANLAGNEQSALYYPWLKVKHPFTGAVVDLPPSGAIAGVFARTDNTRGVFKAPAGTEAVISGAVGFETVVSSVEQESMNNNGVNAMRAFAGTGNLIWGTRTLGDLTGPFRYVPVMRYFLYLRKSLVDGTQFAVFEPNDERLWTTLRMTAEAFMMREFRQGAFQGTTPEACFFVKCDSETNPPGEIGAGFVNLHIGYAPLKPAEFVMIRISHKSATAE